MGNRLDHLDLTGNETNKAAIGARGVEGGGEENGKERHIYDWWCRRRFGANSLRQNRSQTELKIVGWKCTGRAQMKVQSWTGLHLRHHYRLGREKPAAEKVVLPG